MSIKYHINQLGHHIYLHSRSLLNSFDAFFFIIGFEVVHDDQNVVVLIFRRRVWCPFFSMDLGN